MGMKTESTDPIETIRAAYGQIKSEIEAFLAEEEARGRRMSPSVFGTRAAANPELCRTLARAVQGHGSLKPETLRKALSYIQEQRAARESAAA